MLNRIVALASLVFAVSASAQTVLVHDTFSSPLARDSGTLSADRAAWYVMSPNSTALATSSGGSNGTPFTVTQPTGSTSSMAYLAHWSPVSLQVGQKMTVSLTASFAGLPTTTGFRLGIFDSKGTLISSDATSPNQTSESTTFAGDTGYAWTGNGSLAIGTASTGALYNTGERTTLTATNLFSAAGDFTPLGSSNGTNAGFANGTQYTFSMTFDYQAANNLVMSTLLSGGSYGAGQVSTAVTDTTPSATTFDYFIIRVANANAFESITFHGLEISVIPEPSTYAALLGLGVLGLVALRRRRR
jgi:hypothetical protein